MSSGKILVDSNVKQPRHRVLAAPIASELYEDKPSLKREGAGKTGHRLVPMVRVQKISTRQNHRCSRKYPAFPARWLERLLRALPGDRAFLPPSPARRVSVFASLAPASGRQDHTAWPSAKRSFVGMPKGQCCDHSRPPPPASTSVTIAIRPSARGGMRGKMRLIWGQRQAEYFSADIWTGRIDLIAQRKFDFWCKSFCGGN